MKHSFFLQTRGLLFFISILLFSSCTSQAMGIKERSYSVNDFYTGLKTDSAEEKVRLFENALSNTNIFIRQAASEQLAVLMLRDSEISAGTAELVRSEAGGWWAAAFDVVDNLPDREKTLPFLLSFEQNTYSFFDEPRHYVLRELNKRDVIFNGSETAVIDGHYAVSRLQYNDALAAFRGLEADGAWPGQMPRLFFEFPNLINDLGRAFQYTASGAEGLNLFLQWESNLPDTASYELNDIRYRLLFFAARIARRAGSAQTAALFERALSLAPDNTQLDACIWYLLDISLSGQINVIMERMEKFLPLAVNGSTHNDIMERYLHRLAAAQDWSRVIRTFDLIKDIDGLFLKAGFAWVIARAIQENYLSAEQSRLAANAAALPARADASAFMRIAYNASGTLQMPGVYYRALSAAYLNLPFMEFDEAAAENHEQTPALEFLLGFFSNDAPELSVPYIRSMEGTLTPDELRAAAQALDEKEMYTQSIRLIQLYINREDYVKKRRDLEIMYPRPFLELVETHGRNFNIAPSLLFGLMRQESVFQSAVVSRAGAVGLMQLMQPTAQDMASRIRRAGGPDFFSANGTIDSANPAVNVYIGAYYYNYLRNLFGSNDQLSLMAYNGGLARVRRWRSASSLPVDLLVETITVYETRDYGKRIPANAKVYEELYYR